VANDPCIPTTMQYDKAKCQGFFQQNLTYFFFFKKNVSILEFAAVAAALKGQIKFYNTA
jgi:hypothetical protein